MKLLKRSLRRSRSSPPTSDVVLIGFSVVAVHGPDDWPLLEGGTAFQRRRRPASRPGQTIRQRRQLKRPKNWVAELAGGATVLALGSGHAGVAWLTRPNGVTHRSRFGIDQGSMTNCMHQCVVASPNHAIGRNIGSKAQFVNGKCAHGRMIEGVI